MSFAVKKPGPALAPLIEVLWSFEGQPPDHAKEALLPTGTMELVINLKDEQTRVYEGDDAARIRTYGAGILCGVHTAPFVIDTAGQSSVIGVHFRPGGALPFFREPADALRDVHVSLDDLWGTRAAELRERLLACPAPQARLALLEGFLQEQLFQPLPMNPVVAAAIARFNAAGGVAPTVEAVAADLGLSQRRFIQVFSGAVGLTPKLYSRIQRFQQAIRVTAPLTAVDWADLAAACGFYDQAHLIGEFKAFTGLTPSKYLKMKTEHQNHLVLT